MFERFFSLFQSEVFIRAWGIFWDFTPVWLPLILLSIFLSNWLRYVRTKHITEQGSVLLELKLPKEVNKSPAAMEIILQALSQPSVGTFIDVFIKGRVRPWFSLELVSINGEVRFFIWSQKKFKNVIESQIYSQFPLVEIFEVEDYALKVPFDPEVFGYWGMQLKLNKADVYPIKTYVDYGLNENPKEEFKIDPITPVLEFLGSLRNGEQAWIQILIQAHREETIKDGRLQKKPDWKGQAKKEIEKVLSESPVKPEEGKSPNLTGATEIQKETINAIQRNLSKIAFDTMIRGIYLARKDAFNPVSITGLTGSWKQYSSGNLNGFRPDFTTGYDYPWQDFKGRRANEGKKKLLDAYKRRSFFQAPYKFFHGKPFVLTTEELATIFHFPGEVASTPTFTRIVSKKAEPPANLPI